jgi:hypothetical protein
VIDPSVGSKLLDTRDKRSRADPAGASALSNQVCQQQLIRKTHPCFHKNRPDEGPMLK